MQLIGLILPILALYGYYSDHMTLFYWTGSIVAILDIIALLSGSLRCWGDILTLICWWGASRQTDDTWEAIILGSCYSSMIMLSIMSVVLIPLILAAIVGIIQIPFIWIKEHFFED